MASPTHIAPETGTRNRDGFFKETYRFFDALSRNRMAMTITLVVLAGAALVAGMMISNRSAKSETGMNALYGAQKAYETELKSAAGVKTTKPKIDEKADPKAKEAAEKALRAEEEASGKRMDDLMFAKLDVDAKFPEAVKKYRGVIADFGGTRAAHEARMALGTLYYNHGEAAKAAPLFQDAIGSAHGNPEKAMAYQSWGYSLENEGKHSEAVSAFEKSAGLAEGALKGDSLLSLARNQLAMNDAAKARSTYDQIISQLPNTDAAKTAEAFKAKL